MDITIKTRTFEIEALEYLNKHCSCPDLYKGKKYPGFQWAVHLAADSEIDWTRYAKIRLENYFTEKGVDENVPKVTHLTADSDEYAKVAQSIKEHFGLTKLQNAYAIRCIIKYAVALLKEDTAAKAENVVIPEAKIDAICKNQLLILEKLEEIAELLKRDI